MAKNSEEIIERKEGSPVATSCLVIACVAILGAISLQIAEITQVRADWSLEEKNLNRVLHVEDDLDAITSKIDGILEKSKVGDGEKAKAVAGGEEFLEEESDSKDDEAPEKDDTEEAEAPDKEDDASDDSELEDF